MNLFWLGEVVHNHIQDIWTCLLKTKTDNVHFFKCVICQVYLTCWKCIFMLFHVKLCYACPYIHVNMKSTLTQKGWYSPMGNFQYTKTASSVNFLLFYNSLLLFLPSLELMCLSEVPHLLLLSCPDWLPPSELHQKVHLLQRFCPVPVRDRKKATQALYTVTPWVSDVCRASVNKTHCQGKCKYKQMQQWEAVWSDRGLFPYFLKIPKYYGSFDRRRKKKTWLIQLSFYWGYLKLSEKL